MSDEKHVEAAWAKAVEKAAEDAEYVFRDSCSHAAQAIDYMKQVMFTDAPQASQPIGQPVGGAMTDEEIKECIDTIDFSQMVTADDVFYLVARAIEKHILAQASQPVSGAMMDERKLFEDEMRRYGYMEFDLRKGIAGAYIGGNAQIAWHFWKARSLLSASGQAGQSEKAVRDAALEEMKRAEWRAAFHALRDAKAYLCKDGANHTWLDGAIAMAKERSEGRGTYALSSTPAQQTEEKKGEQQ